MKIEELTKDELTEFNGGSEFSEAFVRAIGYILSAVDNSLRNCNLEVTTKI